jgi:hypothetical protein
VADVRFRRSTVSWLRLSPGQQPLELLNIERQPNLVFVESPPQIGLADRL